MARVFGVTVEELMEGTGAPKTKSLEADHGKLLGEVEALTVRLNRTLQAYAEDRQISLQDRERYETVIDAFIYFLVRYERHRVEEIYSKFPRLRQLANKVTEH